MTESTFIRIPKELFRMEIQRLIYMANQISAFFKSYPENQAIASTGNHMEQFWDPRMRQEILQHVQAGGAGLSAIALAAVRKLDNGP